MPELELRLDGDGQKEVLSTLSWKGTKVEGPVIDLRLSSRHLDDLRWLQEDPIVDLYGPGEGRRARAEEAAQRIGEVLFGAVSASEPMRRLLDQALAPGQPTGLVIRSQNQRLLLLPWELMRSPSVGWLNGRLDGLARGHGDPDTSPVPVQVQGKRLRVLLVTARPRAEEDVEYRIVASKLLDQVEKCAEVTVVRPGTFQALERYIGQGRYDLVHYDGHGEEGLLWFEDQPVAASRLGRILARSGVPLFVLNACRSAVNREESQAEPGQINSVAHGLLSTGARGVLAMSANVRVTSAVAYFDRFYAELASGATLSRAAHQARRSLETASHVGPMDWAIPVLYLRSDFTPFQPGTAPSQDVLQILKGESPALEPAGPSDIFIGRDGDLFKVDRALDERSRVLVYGVGGIGKTTLMQHLLRWRRRTGGADRVFSFSFRAAPTLEALAIQLQEAVIGVHPKVRSQVQSPEWANLPTQDKLTGMGQVIAADEQHHWLLLFDNLEILGGYPSMGDGPCSPEDRQDFQSLLGVLENRVCRVVLTARRDEADWLEGRTRRFPLTGVKPWYRFEMLRAYADSFGVESRLKRGADQLGNLLRELGGHPLATRVAAFGLKDRSVAEVVASICGKASQITVPNAEFGMRSESLAAVIAGALSHLSQERRRAMGLVGMFHGRFHQDHLFEIMEDEGFPKAIVPDLSRSLLEGVLREGLQLGLMAPDLDMAGAWEVVPGAQATLNRLWREELRPEQIRIVEQIFLRHWARQARLCYSAFTSRELGRQAIEFLLYEEGNLSSALQMAAAQEDWQAAMNILILFLTVLPILGRSNDSDHLRTLWLQAVSRGGGPRDQSQTDQVDLWRYLMGDLANRAARAGDLKRADRVHTQITHSLESMPRPSKSDRTNLATGYHQKGRVEEQRGRLDEAEKWYRKSLQISEGLEDRSGSAGSYHHLGIIYQQRRQLEEAEKWYLKGLQIYKDTGDRWHLAASFHQLGIVEQLQGQLDNSEKWYRKSLQIQEELGDRPGLAQSLHLLGIVNQHRGRLDEAEESYRKSLQIREELCDHLGLAQSVHQLGNVNQQRGRLDEAEKWYRKSLQIFEELQDRPHLAASYHQLGLIKQQLGQLDEAEKWYIRSLTISEEFGDQPHLSASFHEMGILNQMRRRLDEAEKWHRKSLNISKALGDRLGLASSFHELGMIEEQKGNVRGALELFQASLEIYSQLGLKEVATVTQSIRRLDRTLGREGFLKELINSRDPEELLEDDKGVAEKEKPRSLDSPVRG